MKIPEASLKQSLAIVGRTGSGKTYTAKGLVEYLLACEQRVCIVDPLGVWWGLRSSADGSEAAFPVVVFGGDHADVELTEGMGAALAETLAEQNIPAIVDVSDFSMAGRVRFMTAFLEEIYAQNRSPITLVFDEADMFAPQRPGREQLAMLGRMEHICRRGRVRGFRPWLITQRPASLNKHVLSQVNTLVAMQLTAPQDRDALGDWIEGQASREDGKRVLAELPRLKRGEGFVWAPHEGVLEHVKFPAIATYDSSRTPEDGETLPQVKLAPVDLSKIGKALQKREEQAEAEEQGVATLRARVSELEAQLAADEELGPGAEQLEEAERRGFERAMRKVGEQLLERLGTLAGAIVEAVEGAQAEIAGLEAAERMPNDIQAAAPRRSPSDRPATTRKDPDKYPRNPGSLPAGEERVLTAVAQHRGGVSREQITVLTGYKRSTRDTYIQRLRERGLVADGGGRITVEPAGLKALGPDFRPLPKGAALRRHWLERLPEGERRVLETALDAHPKHIEREQISVLTGYKRSTRDTYLQRLAARQLVLPVGRALVRASPELFE